ncbi:MAG TPA: geranylgeranylglyceryl/heptaprenylglyceryl phosphate synthase [Candidatus Bathyarchaeia archaeon]|nr:geranylgeranylglyceryl/heptaprenylglyceryl phosphate synthase [Candidatus Bathyarchaeia archaeon]
MTGRVERYLLNKIRQDEAVHLTLLDPEKAPPDIAAKTAREAEKDKTAAIMVGGSTVTSTQLLEATVKAIKKAVKIPVILFPNNITGICPHADAIWFMSLINSSDPYFIVGAHVLGAPLVKKFGLEPLPLGYIIVGEGGAASLIGRAFPIPFDKPELAVAHALAAEYLGMRFVYLEAGSGVKKPVPPNMIRMVKDAVKVPLIVGGGIRSGQHAKEAVRAGADMIVTGNITEEGSTLIRLKELISSARSE